MLLGAGGVGCVLLCGGVGCVLLGGVGVCC